MQKRLQACLEVGEGHFSTVGTSKTKFNKVDVTLSAVTFRTPSTSIKIEIEQKYVVIYYSTEYRIVGHYSAEYRIVLHDQLFGRIFGRAEYSVHL